MVRTSILATCFALAGLAIFFFASPSEANPPIVHGAIVDIDSHSRRINVSSHNTRYWFQCTENTIYTLNGFAASFTQLAVGQEVNVALDPHTREALRVDMIVPR
jgi:hypothetical protein